MRDATVRASRKILFQSLPDGESVLLNLEDERYYGLNVVGTQMWHALTEAGTLQEAHSQLVQQYDVASETLWTDLESFVSDLKEAGIVEVDHV